MDEFVSVLDHLCTRFPEVSRSKLRQMMKDKRITLNGEVVVVASTPVGPLDTVAIRHGVAPARKSSLPFEIIHEDPDILVIDKPAGLLTSTNPREKRPTVLAMLMQHYETPRHRNTKIGLIHRLDRDASGLLIFSRNAAAFDSLKGQFYRHSVDRIYLARVAGTPKTARGTIESRLLELPDGRVVRTRKPSAGQRAITHYETLSTHGPTSLVRITLQTGRKHQIRTHLAQLGHPILGDEMYEGPPSPLGLHLRAMILAITHPRTNERLQWQAKPPQWA